METLSGDAPLFNMKIIIIIKHKDHNYYTIGVQLLTFVLTGGWLSCQPRRQPFQTRSGRHHQKCLAVKMSSDTSAEELSSGNQD